jgi:hypothetical protein
MGGGGREGIVRGGQDYKEKWGEMGSRGRRLQEMGNRDYRGDG